MSGKDKTNKAIELKDEVLSLIDRLEDITVPDDQMDTKTKKNALLSWLSTLLNISEELLQVVDRVLDHSSIFIMFY